MRENLTVLQDASEEDGFEVLGQIDDLLGILRAPAIAGGPSYAPGPKFWVRFFRALPNGEQAESKFCSAFDALDFVIFSSNPRRYRQAIQANSDLSRDQEETITKILRGRRGNLHLVPSPPRGTA
jgi:hypothetical protein